MKDEIQVQPGQATGEEQIVGEMDGGTSSLESSVMALGKRRWKRDWKSYLEQLVEGLIDEDEGDKDGENFLRKTWDKADQEASFEGHSGHHDDN